MLIAERKKIDIKDLEIIVINTEKRSITAEMVKKVAELKKKYPEITESIFNTIDLISLAAVDFLHKGNLSSLSDLVVLNQLMLKSLGVSTQKIDKIIEEIEKLGLKLKITGAGGGGAVIVLCWKENSERIMHAIKGLAKAVYRAEFDMRGVRTSLEH